MFNLSSTIYTVYKLMLTNVNFLYMCTDVCSTKLFFSPTKTPVQKWEKVAGSICSGDDELLDQLEVPTIILKFLTSKSFERITTKK